MDRDIFNADLLSYAQVFKMMVAPLGDYAPRGRLLSVDYKNQDGVDCSQDIAVGQAPGMTDERLVKLIQEQYAGMGFTVSAIIEVIEEGTPRALTTAQKLGAQIIDFGSGNVGMMFLPGGGADGE